MSMQGPKAIIFSDKEEIVYKNLLALRMDKKNPASQEKYKSNFARLNEIQKRRFLEFADRKLSSIVKNGQQAYNNMLDQGSKSIARDLRV